MTKDNNPYIQQMNSEPTTDDPLYDDLEGELTEGMLRGFSKVILINKIRKLDSEIKKTKNVEKQLDLIGSQNLYLSMLIFVKT